MSFASLNLEEAWRWQAGTSLLDGTLLNAGALDSGGNLVVGGVISSEMDGDSLVQGKFAVFKLDGTIGEQLWSWTGSAEGDTLDLIYGVAVDGADDIVAGGQTAGAEVPSSSSFPSGVSNFNMGSADVLLDWAAVKLNGDTGDEIWRYQRAFNESSSYGSGPIHCVATTSDKHVFLVGTVTISSSDGNSDHFQVAKLDGTTGEELWVVDSQSNNYKALTLTGCAVNSDDDLIATGYGSTDDATDLNSATETGIIVVRFNNDGGGHTFLYWETDGERKDYAMAMAVDFEDNIYVAGGDEVDDSGFAKYSTVRKLDSSGDEMWRHVGVSPEEDGAIYMGVTVDASTGRVVAVGHTNGVWVDGQTYTGGDSDFVATALDLTGGVELERWQDGTDAYDRMDFTAFDSEGSLLMAGRTSGSWAESGGQGDMDFVGVKFRFTDDDGSSNNAGIIAGITVPCLLLVICGAAACESRGVLLEAFPVIE